MHTTLASDGEQLTMLARDDAGTYREIASSQVLPGLSPDDLMRFVSRRQDLGEATMIRQFRAWSEHGSD